MEFRSGAAHHHQLGAVGGQSPVLLHPNPFQPLQFDPGQPGDEGQGQVAPSVQSAQEFPGKSHFHALLHIGMSYLYPSLREEELCVFDGC